MRFCQGDKIVYPLYGAGYIEGLEENEIDGVNETYYVMRIPVTDLTIKFPVNKAENIGIREVYHKDKVMDIIISSARVNVNMSENWNQRYKENLEKIKSGCLKEVAVVYRNLLKRERAKSLSNAEKKMLTTVKQIIVSEIALSQNIEKGIAEDILLSTVMD